MNKVLCRKRQWSETGDVWRNEFRLCDIWEMHFNPRSDPLGRHRELPSLTSSRNQSIISIHLCLTYLIEHQLLNGTPHLCVASLTEELWAALGAHMSRHQQQWQRRAPRHRARPTL